jgi:hypothetical protein
LRDSFFFFHVPRFCLWLDQRSSQTYSPNPLPLFLFNHHQPTLHFTITTRFTGGHWSSRKTFCMSIYYVLPTLSISHLFSSYVDLPRPGYMLAFIQNSIKRDYVIQKSDSATNREKVFISNKRPPGSREERQSRETLEINTSSCLVKLLAIPIRQSAESPNKEIMFGVRKVFFFFSC